MLQFFLQNLENIIKNKCLESFYKFWEMFLKEFFWNF
jgi:hypothetical protein